MENVILFGIALLWVIAMLLFQFHKQKTYKGITEGRVIRRDPPYSVRPWRAKLIFEYMVDGIVYKGSTPRVNGKDELQVGDTLLIQYKLDNPKKYYCK